MSPALPRKGTIFVVGVLHCTIGGVTITKGTYTQHIVTMIHITATGIKTLTDLSCRIGSYVSSPDFKKLKSEIVTSV